MPHVPAPSRTRSGHGMRRRTTHDYDAYASVVEDGAASASDQTSLDRAGGIGSADLLTGAQLFGSVENLPATVTIDDTGILIQDGALTLQDEFGLTVMRASGFAGSWDDFIATGLYNGQFASGGNGVSGTAITAGRTVLLPYWTVTLTGSPTFNWVIRNNSGVLDITVDTAQGVQLFSDARGVQPLDVIRISAILEVTSSPATSGFAIAPTVYWYRSDGTACTTATTAVTSRSWTNGDGTFSPTEYEFGIAIAPSDARYARVYYAITLGSVNPLQFYFHAARATVLAPGTSAGLTARAAHPSISNATVFSGSPLSLAAAGGAVLCPIWVPSPMQLRRYDFWNTDAATARSVEIALYVDIDRLGVLYQVPGSRATASWTPVAAAVVSTADVTSAPVYIRPGWYYICIRNTHATNTVSIGGQSNSATLLAVYSRSSTTTPLGTTLSPSAWTGSGRLIGVSAVGDVAVSF